MSLADELHSVNYYGDNTGAPVPSNHKMRKGYQPVTTSRAQHMHNYPFDPSNDDEAEGTVSPPDLRDTVTENDFWVDTSPA